MLLRKVVILFLILLLIEQFFHHAVIKKMLPTFWGNEEVYEKIDFLNNHKNINTVFVGSSKIKSQILPEVFDSATNYQVKSFNLGCNGLFIPESFQIVDYLLDSTQMKYIFFDVRPVYHIYYENLHITRTIYYHTLTNYISTIKNAYSSNLPLIRKINVYSTFTVAELENLLNFNFMEGYIGYKNYALNQSEKKYAEENGAGILGDAPSSGLLNSPDELYERAKISSDYIHKYNVDSLGNLKPNKAYAEELERLIDKAEKKNVKMVLLFPPSLRDFEYKEMLPILRLFKFKNASIIIMSDASEFPELYEVKNNYETDHLNKQGDVFYSGEIGKKFTKMLLR